MPVFLIRIGGCNFAATAFDTQDLSTIRGASLAYLRHADAWPKRLKAELPGILPIVVGASDGIYRVETSKSVPAIEAAVAKAIAAPPTADPLDATRPRLTFTYAVIAEGGDYKNDVASLVARCRQRQLQQLTVDVPPPSRTSKACEYDRVRPADSVHTSQDGADVDVSASVDARRSYGRKERQEFYKAELGSSSGLGFDFVDSFQELVTDNPKPLPPALTGKHAVVYLDGNGFTGIREEVIFKARDGDTCQAVRDRQQKFSSVVREARRNLLSKILNKLSSDTNMLLARSKTGTLQRLKFETLLWGGDEALFVLPAWKLMELLPAIAEQLESAVWQLPKELGPHKLSHAVGIVICNVKTPIAVSRALAEEVANGSKFLAKNGVISEAYRNVYSIQILESIEPPRASLKDFRRDLYGTDCAAAFTLVGKAGVDGVLDLIHKFQAEEGGLPRSQLFKLIGEARKQGLLEAEKGAEGQIFFDGTGKDQFTGDASKLKVSKVSDALARCRCEHLADMRSPLLGYTSAAPLMPLMRLAELWDYVDPQGRRP